MNAETLCFDLGGTGLKCALISGGRILRKLVIPTETKRGLDGIRDTIRAGAAAFGADAYEAVGFSTAGDVDAAEGKIVYATDNLPGYTGFRLTAFVRGLTGRPCRALNDGEAALLGELYARNGVSGRAAMLTIGTGIGGAYALDGRIVPPSRLGHLTLRPGGRACNCGKRGCIEAYASGAALGRYIREAGLTCAGREVWPLYAAGDRRAAAAVQTWLAALSASVERLYKESPFRLLILGGGVADSAAYWLDGLKEVNISAAIESTRLGGDAGLLGAYAFVKGSFGGET